MAPCTYSLERRAEGQDSLISIIKPDSNEFTKIRVGCHPPDPIVHHGMHVDEFVRKVLNHK